MVATTVDDGRLGRLEGRVDELSIGIQDLRAGQRELSSRIDRTNEEINGRIDRSNEEINGRIDRTTSRIDRLFLALMGIGAAQIGLLVTLIVRST